jgi:hypothetical protein
MGAALFETIFVWAYRTLGAYWPPLFALAAIQVVIPMTEIALSQGREHALPLALGGSLGLIQILIVTCTSAAMYLVVTSASGAGTNAMRRTFLRGAWRFLPLGVAPALLYLVTTTVFGFIAVHGQPDRAQARASAGFALLLADVVLVAPSFLLLVAFVNAVVEGTTPLTSLRNAWRRTNYAGWGLAIGLVLASGFLAFLVPAVVEWIANGLFPPERVPFNLTFPTNPPGAPFPPHGPFTSVPTGVTVPGPYGSGIPWGAHLVMKLVNIPLNAYLDMVALGTALAFADFADFGAEPQGRELVAPDVVLRKRDRSDRDV